MRRLFAASADGEVVEVWEVIATAATLDDAIDAIARALNPWAPRRYI